MKRKFYFAYGANMCVDSMKYRCPEAVPVTGYILRDWQLKFYSHATIEPRPGGRVAGILWSITGACEHSLDMFEGFPNYYTKSEWKQDSRELFFYEMTSPKTGSPSDGYVGSIERAYKHWDLPADMLYHALEHEQSHTN